MRFKMDRLCELAGVPFSSRRGRLLRENIEDQEEGVYEEAYQDNEEVDEFMDYSKKSCGIDEQDEEYEEDLDGDGFGDLYEEDDEDDDEEDNEVIEVDEKELVQELRRAKRIMREGKRKAAIRKRRRKQALQEAQLKAVIDQEVKNVLKEMDLNLNSSWIYGKRKPKRSRHGYTHQGAYLKGIGFK